MPISDKGVFLGHFYDSTRTNAPCGQCESDHYAATGEFVLFLDCRFDDGNDEEEE
jgi:hypothetical protein